MADRKISALTALTGANTASGDLVPIVDISEASDANKNKSITVDELMKYDNAVTSFTPSFTNFSLGNGVINHAFYTRIKGYMFGDLKVTIGSTTSITGIIQFAVPDSNTISSSLTASTYTEVGHGIILDASAAILRGILMPASSTVLQLGYLNTNAQIAYATAAGPMTWVAGDSFQVCFYFPIDGWDA